MAALLRRRRLGNMAQDSTVCAPERPPSTLARFEAYCENRRKSLEEEVLEDLGGRRLLECQQNYPDLEAKPIWDVATCVDINQ